MGAEEEPEAPAAPAEAEPMEAAPAELSPADGEPSPADTAEAGREPGEPLGEPLGEADPAELTGELTLPVGEAAASRPQTAATDEKRGSRVSIEERPSIHEEGPEALAAAAAAAADPADPAEPADPTSPTEASFSYEEVVEDILSLGHKLTIEYIRRLLAKMGHKLIKRHARWLSAADDGVRPSTAEQGAEQAEGARPGTADTGTRPTTRGSVATAATDIAPEDHVATAGALVRVLTKVIEMARDKRDSASPSAWSTPRTSKAACNPLSTANTLNTALDEEITGATEPLNLGDNLFNPAEYFSKKQRAEFESMCRGEAKTPSSGGSKARMSFDEIMEFVGQMQLNLPRDRVKRLTRFFNTFSDNLTRSTDTSGKAKRRNSFVKSDGEILCSDGAFYRFVAIVTDASKVTIETAEDVQTLVSQGWTEAEICELFVSALPRSAPVEDRSAVLVKLLTVLGIKYSSISSAGVTLKQCLDADIELSELRDAGWNSSGAREAGVELKSLLNCGFSLRELIDVQKLTCIHDWHLLREAGANVAQMRACGIPVYELKLAGYSGAQLIEGGVSPRIVEQTRKHLVSVSSAATEEAGAALEQLGPGGGKKARALLEAAHALVLHPHAARLFPADFNGNSLWAVVKGTPRLEDTPLHATVRIREEWQLVSSNYKTLREHPEHKQKKAAAAKKGAEKKSKKASKDAPKEKKEVAAA